MFALLLLCCCCEIPCVSSRCEAAGDHVWLWMHVCAGQLLRVHDFFPRVRLARPGGKGSL